MPVNKLALIRYKKIDSCLQNRLRKWTLEDLVDACSEALYEYEGIKRGISKRAVQLDIQNMRSDKLGYSAPIIVTDKKYYSYEDKKYTITNIPLSAQDLNTLNEVLGILKQFKGFGHFQELNDMVTRLDDRLYSELNNGVSYIDMEKNNLLRGLQHIDTIHKAIKTRKVLAITYKSFKAQKENVIYVSAYLLKEYRNRWFVIGVARKAHDIITLALDRIEGLELAEEREYRAPVHDMSLYFNDVIGATKLAGQRAQKIIFRIMPEQVPYVVTKPLHHSQQLLKTEDNGSAMFAIDVIWNFELEKEILAFGEHIRVLSPARLVRKIYARMEDACKRYRNDE